MSDLRVDTAVQVADDTPDAIDTASTRGTTTALPPPPVAIRLKPESDKGAGALLLGALNRGKDGRFRVEVIDAHNQDGEWEGPRSWPVPWLEGGTVAPMEVPKFGKPLLDFARFEPQVLEKDAEG